MKIDQNNPKNLRNLSSWTVSKSLWLPFVVYFFLWFSVGLSFPLFSYFLFHQEFAFVPAETTDAMRGLWLGALFATLSIVQFVTSPIFGTLSDEKGRKTILLLALTANFLGCLLTNFAVELENLNLLLFARVLVGMGAGGTAVILAIVADLSPPMLLAKNFGLFNTFRYLGYAAGMYMSGGLSHVPIFNISPFEKPFAVATLGSLICVILILFFFKETHLIAKKGVALKNFFTNLVKGFQIARLNMLLIIFFVFFFGWSMYWEFMPVTWLKILDVTPSQIGLFYAYGIVINSICSALLIRPIFDWISNGKILFFSIVILGTSIVFLLFNLKVSFLWFFIAIEQFMLALIYPSAMTMALKITPKGMQGQTLGNYNSVKALAYAFSPLSGILMGISYKMPFFIAVVFILCSGLLLWISFRKAIFSTNT